MKQKASPADVPVYLFKQGNNFESQRFFGAHFENVGETEGVMFRVWAPRAKAVSVVGDFNSWIPSATPMKNIDPQGGIWERFVPGIRQFDIYKYCVTTPADELVFKADPYAFHAETRPANCSKVYALEDCYNWTDDAWQKRAAARDPLDRPMNIYEMHAGSWRTYPDGNPFDYRALARELVPYLTDMGYTHVELMPLMEYPFDGSWGYQVTGYFAPTSRYGTPDDLRFLIGACHRAGIGVLLDFVPVHFAVNDYALLRYDGTALYEYPHQDVGFSEWGSCNFMHSRGEIRCFIQSCADYWLRVFHADGLRMDAVSRLIYWQGDPNRGVNGSTLDFLKGMNCGLQQRHPTAILIAEDSTSFPKVTAPVEYGGLGFDYKWDMGWMNDTLDYFKKTPDERRENLGKLTFSMMYAWNEHYILPFSHDENVHGKATIVQKMYGDYEGKFPQARALYLYMAIHPGKMLDFMGNEFAQLREFDESREQDWMVLKYPSHDDFHRYRKALNEAYCANEAFWSREYDPAAFQWLDCRHPELDACAIWREGHDGAVLAAFNFGDTELKEYELTLPRAGRLTPILDTDWQCFGGQTEKPKRLVGKACEGKLKLTLAPFSGRLYKLV